MQTLTTRLRLAAATLLALSGALFAWAVPAAETPAAAQKLVDSAVKAMRVDPDASKRYAEQALVLLSREPNADLEIRARLILCDYLSERDKDAAEREISQATALLPLAQRQGLRAGVLTCEGDINETAGDNSRAKALYEQAVAVGSATHDDEMLAGALFSRGYLMGVQGAYAAGLSDLRRAQSLYEKSSMRLHAVTVLNAIAILYNRMGDNQQAVHIYTRALKEQRESGLRREVAVTLYNLGRAHENLKEWEFARRSFTESRDINKEIGYARGEAYAHRGLAAVANATGDSRRALDILKQADALSKQTSDARLSAHIQLVRGVALHRLARLADSEAALMSALDVFRQADALGDLSTCYSELSLVQAEMGNWRDAYTSQTQYKLISDRLLNNQLDQRFATLKVEFDTTAKEQENVLLLRENQATEKALSEAKRARQLQAVAIALTVLLAVLLATFAVRQRRATLRMRKLALTDELTGVPNRRDVLNRLEELLSKPGESECCALIIDIDHFKSINDLHGHPVGDEVLKFVAREIRTAVREPAFFGRLGGEEFLIVLPGTTLDGALPAADRFREQIMTVDTTRWLPVRRRITASIGVTVSRPGICSSSDMLMRADGALYAAKRGGRNCVKTFEEDPGPHSPQSQLA
jgi:diguanylate cyclase (GGDEF)-like protein